MRLITTIVIALVLSPHPGSAESQEVQQAVLDLTVNTVPGGEIRVLLAGTDVWADVETLASAGLASLEGERRIVAGRAFLRLASMVPRPVVVLDTDALTLAITADPSLFPSARVQLDTARPGDIVYRRAGSAFVNYGATWSSSSSTALNLESGVTLGRAFMTSSWYFPSAGRTSRGMTAAIVDDRTRMRRYQFGDAVAATGPLGGAIQFAGVSVSRDFSLDPYFIRYPTTGLSGVVTTPSRLDVYVNNQLVRTLQVQPGAYELANLALPTGAASTRVVVRDAFGGEQEFGGSFYVTTGILARGLHQYQYAAGVERLRPFDTLWEYGRAIATATHRVGVTDDLTLGARAEVEPGLANGGVVATARAGRFGVFELSGAASRAEAGGIAGGLAYEYIGRHGGVSFAWRRASDTYETLTTRRRLGGAMNELLASVSSRVNRRVTAGVSWQLQDDRIGAGARRVAATASVALAAKLSLFLSASRSRLDGVWSNGAFASLAVSLGSRASASVSAEQLDGDRRGVFDIQQSAPVGPGYGLRGQVAGLGSAATLVDAEVRAQNRWGQADIRQSVLDGRRETWAQFNGALVAIGGRVMASRPVQDGFALVRVPDVAGVRAYVSHQEMGRTDRHGDLLLPNLLPYYGNRIAIEDTDVPVDRTVSAREVTLAPPYRGGAIAEFPALRQQRLSGRVVLPDGTPIAGPQALDATARIAGPVAVETWLGSGGELYVEGLGAGDYTIEVTAPALACTARFAVPESDAPVVGVGDIRCTPHP
jgi:outer membrane usher protein